MLIWDIDRSGVVHVTECSAATPDDTATFEIRYWHGANRFIVSRSNTSCPGVSLKLDDCWRATYDSPVFLPSADAQRRTLNLEWARITSGCDLSNQANSIDRYWGAILRNLGIANDGVYVDFRHDHEPEPQEPESPPQELLDFIDTFTFS